MRLRLLLRYLTLKLRALCRVLRRLRAGQFFIPSRYPGRANGLFSEWVILIMSQPVRGQVKESVDTHGGGDGVRLRRASPARNLGQMPRSGNDRRPLKD
jgi:hypothetical protein